MEKINVTTGNWKLGQETSYNGNKGFEIWYNNDGECIADCVYKKDDAILIADAGTIYNQCEKLPSELLAENKELMEFIKRISIYDTTVKNMFEVKKEAQQLINKLTK